MEASGQLHTLAHLLPGKNTDTHWIGGWVGPRASLEDLDNIKMSCPYEDLNSILSSLQQSHYTDYAISLCWDCF